jgi:hypothetical protein
VVNGYDDGYAVTGSTILNPIQNYLTDVGAYTSSPSFYGTFDQGGNVWEWNETVPTYTNAWRVVRGGSWTTNSNNLRSFGQSGSDPLAEYKYLGFRMASIPVPSGDYNGNGVVDAADYVLWRKNPANYGNSAGYSTWRSNFGQSVGSGATIQETVPEPSTAALICLAAVAFGFPARRRI